MSVWIKGLKMPHNCEECGLTSHRSEGLGLCHILHKQCNYDIRPKDCPLVEVSEPHGDLIDREEISVDVYEDADGFHYEVSAPTVIEAEE